MTPPSAMPTGTIRRAVTKLRFSECGGRGRLGSGIDPSSAKPAAVPALDRGATQPVAGLSGLRAFGRSLGSQGSGSSPSGSPFAAAQPKAARRRRQGLPIGLVLGGVGLGLIAATAAAEADLHPQDGPHCEVVVRIREQGVEVKLSPNLVFLDTLFEFPREDPGAIAPTEVWALRDLLAAHFATPSIFPIVSIDGAEPPPVLGEILVNAPDPDLLPLFVNTGMRGLRKIAFTLDYPTGSLPREVAIRWRDFPPDPLSTLDEPLPMIITVELLSPGKRDLIELSVEEPEHIWHAPTPEEAAAASMAVPAAPPPPVVRTLAMLPVVVCTAGAILAAISLQRGWRRGGGLAVVILLATATAATVGRKVWPIVLSREESPLPSVEEAAAIFTPLQRGIYASFDLDEEGEVYDALATCVDGPLLPRVYRTVRRSLVMEEEGGAVGRVIELRPLEIEIESIGLVEPPVDPAPLVANGNLNAEAAAGAGAGPGGESPPTRAGSSGTESIVSGSRDSQRVGFTVRCKWQVDGAVYHWGHGHFRTNEYEGRFLVVATDEGWRIAGDELISQRRVDEPEDEGTGDPPAAAGDDEEFEV